MPPCGKTERVLQIGKIRMRFALVQTCQFFALSVICFANASSPKGRAEKSVRTFCPYAQSKLVSPFGRDVAQRQRGLVSADMAFQICPDTSLSACCPLSHLLRKCQLSQRESREAGANLFALTHKPNLSLPLGEMSRSDREGWYQLAWLFKFALVQTCQFFALSVICSANASSPKGRAEKSVRISCPYAQSKLVSPSGRDVAQRQRGLVSADMAFQICPDTGFFCFPHKTKESTDLYSLLWWEVVDSLFCGKATPVATCIQHVAKSRLSNPLLPF